MKNKDKLIYKIHYNNRYGCSHICVEVISKLAPIQPDIQPAIIKKKK